MQTKRSLKLCIIFLLLLAILSGCWDRRELEERITVVGLGIDREEQTESDQPMYLVTIQIPIPLRIAGAGGGAGGGGGAEAVRMVSSTGFTVGEAFANLQKSLNQRLFLGHTRVVAISKELAEEGVEDILDIFRRDPSLRRLLWFLVTEGRAEDLLNANPELETIPITYIISLIENGAKMGEIPDITLGNFFVYLTSSSLQAATNYVRSSKEDVSWIGLALFNDDKLIGTLDSKESWTLMQLRGEKPGGRLLIPFTEDNTDKHFLINPLHSNTSTKINIKNGQVQAHYHVELEANITEKNFDLDLSKASNLNKLARITEEELEKKAQKLVNKLQHTYKVDTLMLGSKIRAFHFNEWSRLEWEDAFPEAEIKVTYNVEFRRVGMELR